MLRLVGDTGMVAEPVLARRIAAAAKTPLERCQDCGKCSAGCPVAFAMDYLPNQIAHLVRLGLPDRALGSNAIWLCASCETCATRCPMDIDLAAIMDVLRQEARRTKGPATGGRVGAFHTVFLSSVKKYGRAHELGLVGALKLKTRDLFSDLALGVRMFVKGKFGLLPQRVRQVQQVRGTFSR